jgi:phosphoribosyl transferase domain protein
MSIFILQDHLASCDKHWIERCQSKSMETGYRLREAHYTLGEHMAEKILDMTAVHRPQFAVLILMRAGLPFGMGIADKLEKAGSQVAIYFIHHDINNEIKAEIADRTIILVDAVINSGKSIQQIMITLPEMIRQSVILTTTVIPKETVSKFEQFNLLVVRVSSNQYQGAKVSTITQGKGPDTGDRLFGTL